MRPTPTQHFAIEALLNQLIGRDVYDQYFLGVEFALLLNSKLNVFAADAMCAQVLANKYGCEIAIAAEHILSSPVQEVIVTGRLRRTA